jgi:hypothetical protein
LNELSVLIKPFQLIVTKADTAAVTGRGAFAFFQLRNEIAFRILDIRVDREQGLEVSKGRAVSEYRPIRSSSIALQRKKLAFVLSESFEMPFSVTPV